MRIKKIAVFLCSSFSYAKDSVWCIKLKGKKCNRRKASLIPFLIPIKYYYSNFCRKMFRWDKFEGIVFWFEKYKGWSKLSSRLRKNNTKKISKSQQSIVENSINFQSPQKHILLSLSKPFHHHHWTQKIILNSHQFPLSYSVILRTFQQVLVPRKLFMSWIFFFFVAFFSLLCDDDKFFFFSSSFIELLFTLYDAKEKKILNKHSYLSQFFFASFFIPFIHQRK